MNGCQAGAKRATTLPSPETCASNRSPGRAGTIVYGVTTAAVVVCVLTLGVTVLLG